MPRGKLIASYQIRVHLREPDHVDESDPPEPTEAPTLTAIANAIQNGLEALVPEHVIRSVTGERLDE